MATIFEAKKLLRDRFRHEEGFAGVSIGRKNGEDTLRVYVVGPDAPIVRRLTQIGRFEGFPVEIVVSGKIQASA